MMLEHEQEESDITQSEEWAKNQDFLEIWSVQEMSSINTLPKGRTVLCPSKGIRQQLYHVESHAVERFQIKRAQGVYLPIPLRDYVVLNLEDYQDGQFKLAVHPEWVWEKTGQLVTPELAHWSIEHAPEIVEMVEYALTEVFDLFDWRPRGFDTEFISAEDGLTDALYFNEDTSSRLIAFGNTKCLGAAESLVRNFSVAYRQNCLWLGAAILFDVHLFLWLQRPWWNLDDLNSVQPGDLLALQQHAGYSGEINLRARIQCKSVCSNQWSREVYFKMSEHESNIQIGGESWKGSSVDAESEYGYHDGDGHDLENALHANPGSDYSLRDGVVQGMDGPEDVLLEVVAGRTQINFNELCNIQEGSLIELQTHTLPMVRLTVRGVPILEGELVRFRDTLMVQVTQRVENGNGDN